LKCYSFYPIHKYKALENKDPTNPMEIHLDNMEIRIDSE